MSKPFPIRTRTSHQPYVCNCQPDSVEELWFHATLTKQIFGIHFPKTDRKVNQNLGNNFVVHVSHTRAIRMSSYIKIASTISAKDKLSV